MTGESSAAHDEPATGAAHGDGKPSHQRTDADAGSPDPSASSTSTKPPSENCCYAALSVEAVGLKNLGNRLDVQPLGSELRINGQIVGQTPFTDELPASDYLVEVVGANGEVRSAVVKLRPNGARHIRAEFSQPLDADELRARSAWRLARVERARWEERTEFRRVHSVWAAETQPLRTQRAQRQTLGFIVGGSGAALLVTGVVLEVMAGESNADAESAQSQWLGATDPQQRSVWLQRAQNAEDARDTEHTLGLAALGVGGAALVAGGVLLLSAPRVPDEPEFRPSWRSASRCRFELVPRFGSRSASVLATLRL